MFQPLSLIGRQDFGRNTSLGVVPGSTGGVARDLGLAKLAFFWKKYVFLGVLS